MPKGGRPSDYRPRFAAEAERLARLGATDVEMAKFWEINVSTFYLWQKKHPEFSKALKDGKLASDSNVTGSLYSRAIGHSHKAVKIFNNDGDPLIVPYTERYPPDTTACIFWLKNRRSTEWREKSEVEVTGNVAALVDAARKRAP